MSILPVSMGPEPGQGGAGRGGRRGEATTRKVLRPHVGDIESDLRYPGAPESHAYFAGTLSGRGSWVWWREESHPVLTSPLPNLNLPT